uniref:dyslexia-associated protein KIAA0319-like protein n=1 Tax=Styela clava TaxID=7725 RepID=UPI00193A62EB|nr:dyslexia-associated protein KIAA0319-like protein [Styela clava]
MNCNSYQIMYSIRILILWIIFQITAASDGICNYELLRDTTIKPDNISQDATKSLFKIDDADACGQKCCDIDGCMAGMFRIEDQICLLINCDEVPGGCVFQDDNLPIVTIRVKRESKKGDDAIKVEESNNNLDASTNEENIVSVGTNNKDNNDIIQTSAIPTVHVSNSKNNISDTGSGMESPLSSTVGIGNSPHEETSKSLNTMAPSVEVTTSKPPSSSTVSTSTVPNTSPAPSATTITSTSTSSTLATTTKSTTVERIKLTVSTGGNQEIRLPVDSVAIHADVSPLSDHPYDYLWKLIKHPEDFQGTQSGIETETLKLATLTQGEYEFKVEVSGENSYGEASVNITVLPKLRVNKPPVAVISPTFQELTLPTDSTLLDGSQSHDDDGIETYEWEEVEGPLQANINKDKNGNLPNEKVLKITGLIVGNYTFKLTVTDTDKVTDYTEAIIIVKNKIDNPPIANAGSNQVIHLPQTSAVLCGNDSTDDWGIVNYKWSLSPDSKKDVVDMQGARKKCIELSNLEVGDYTFQLTVTDEAGQEDTAKVTIIVQPESNHPPLANAGTDQQLLLPLENGVVTGNLDGSASKDDKSITTRLWKMTSGPQPVTIVKPDDLVTSVTGITKPGKYVMTLTVTDADGASSSDDVVITVKEEQPPIALAGSDIILTLPDNVAMLDGSKSTDDYGITEYEWIRSDKSPAAGYFLNESNHQAVLHVAGLVQGSFTFILKVTNIRGKSSQDEARVTVVSDPLTDNLVELHLDANILRFDEAQKQTVIKQLEVLLSLQPDDKIIVTDVFAEHGTGHMIVLFYVKSKDGQILPAMTVTDSLNSKLKYDVDFLEFKFLRADTYVCENTCSGHGRCHSGTHDCECDLFWMENFFRVYMGDGKRNCDWSVLYVGIVTFIIITLFSCAMWFFACFCLKKRNKRSPNRRRKNYTTHDKARYEKLPMKPHRNGHVRKNGYVRPGVTAYKSSSIMRSISSSTSSLSDSDAAKEHTLFERKRLLLSSNGGGRPNGAFDPIEADFAKVKVRKSSSSSFSKNSNNSAQRGENYNPSFGHQSTLLRVRNSDEEDIL